MHEQQTDSLDEDANVSDEPSFSFDPVSIVESAFNPKANLPPSYSLSQSLRPRKPQEAAPTKVVSKRHARPNATVSNLAKAKSETLQQQSPEPFHFTDNSSAATSNLRMGQGLSWTVRHGAADEAELAMVDEEETPMKKKHSLDDEPSSATLSHKLTSKRSKLNPAESADGEEFSESLKEAVWAFLRAKSEGKKV